MTKAKNIAYVALVCAILIGSQYVLSAIAGVEIVTLVFVCFAFVFGIANGVMCAVAFSLLRCFIFGFYPNVIVVYLIYYPLTAVIFGALGHIKKSFFDSPPLAFSLAVNALLALICTLCAVCFAFDLIKVSKFFTEELNAFLWVVFSLSAILLISYDGLLIANKIFKKNTGTAIKSVAVTAFAVLCTISFTLIDDVVTPLLTGFSQTARLAYFYSSVLTMLIQSVCTAVSVGILFLPVTEILYKAKHRT